MNEHIGDDAEVYALGMLEATRRAEVDAHAAACPACLRALGEAEEGAAALAAVLPAAAPSDGLGVRFAPPPSSTRLRRTRWYAGLAAAAALLLALGTSWLQLGTARRQLEAQQLAIATLVHSHFLHVSMTTTAAVPLRAKVVYARDGSWIYILVDGAAAPLEATAEIGDVTWPAGTTVVAGKTATLFARPPGRPQRVELADHGTVVAVARLIY